MVWISGCASLSQRCAKKLLHSVDVTTTVCHIKGSRSLFVICLWTFRRKSDFALCTAFPRASSHASLADSASSPVRKSSACIPFWFLGNFLGMNGSDSTRSIIFSTGIALELAELRENCLCVFHSARTMRGKDTCMVVRRFPLSAMLSVMIFASYNGLPFKVVPRKVSAILGMVLYLAVAGFLLLMPPFLPISAVWPGTEEDLLPPFFALSAMCW